MVEQKQQICSSERVKEIIGETGSCRMLVIPQPQETRSGSCVGKMNKLMCVVKYSLSASEAKMSLKCSTMEQDLETTGSSFKVAAILKNSEGKQVLHDDGLTYINLSSSLVKLKLQLEDGILKDQQVSIDLGLGGVPLTDVLCI
jgi:hypothetical protein